MIADRIPEIQRALREAQLDGWLFAVFQLNDPISLDLLGLGGTHLVTRRCYYLIPAQGEPRKLVNRLEPAMLDALPGKTGLHHLAGTPRGGRGAGRRPAAAGGAVQPAQPAPHRVAPRRRHRRPAARRGRRAGVRRPSWCSASPPPGPTSSSPAIGAPAPRCTSWCRAAFAWSATRCARGGAVDEYAVQRFMLEGFEQRGIWADRRPSSASTRTAPIRTTSRPPSTLRRSRRATSC